MNYYDKLPAQYKYLIRIDNRKTGEILEQAFVSSDDVEIYENMLDFVSAEYEIYSRENGEKWEKLW